MDAFMAQTTIQYVRSTPAVVKTSWDPRGLDACLDRELVRLDWKLRRNKSGPRAEQFLAAARSCYARFQRTLDRDARRRAWRFCDRGLESV